MTRLLRLSVAVLLAVCVAMAVGEAETDRPLGPTPGGAVNVVDTDRVEVVAAANAALEHFNRMSNSLNKSILLRVVKASSQVVSGVQYRLQVEVGLSTACSKADAPITVEECPVDQASVQTYDVTITWAPWKEGGEYELGDFALAENLTETAIAPDAGPVAPSPAGGDDGAKGQAAPSGDGAASDCICTMEYDPVCDPETGKELGGNPCVARCEGHTVFVPCGGAGEGERDPVDPPPCICTMEFAPVCDPETGRQLGSNRCMATCKGFTSFVPCGLGEATVAGEPAAPAAPDTPAAAEDEDEDEDVASGDDGAAAPGAGEGQADGAGEAVGNDDVVDGGLVGAPTDAALDEDVRKAVDFAVREVNKRSNGIYKQILVHVTSAQSQVVQGIKYVVTFEVGQARECRTSDAGLTVEECPLDESVPHATLTAEVWYRAWVSQPFELLSFGPADEAVDAIPADSDSDSDSDADADADDGAAAPVSNDGDAADAGAEGDAEVEGDAAAEAEAQGTGDDEELGKKGASKAVDPTRSDVVEAVGFATSALNERSNSINKLIQVRVTDAEVQTVAGSLYTLTLVVGLAKECRKDDDGVTVAECPLDESAALQAFRVKVLWKSWEEPPRTLLSADALDAVPVEEDHEEGEGEEEQEEEEEVTTTTTAVVADSEAEGEAAAASTGDEEDSTEDDSSAPPMVGAPEATDSEDEMIVKVAQFAVGEQNKASNALKELVLVRVVDARKQLVAGLRFWVTIEVGLARDCPNDGVQSTLQDCPVDESSVRRHKVDVLWQAWMPTPLTLLNSELLNDAAVDAPADSDSDSDSADANSNEGVVLDGETLQPGAAGAAGGGGGDNDKQDDDAADRGSGHTVGVALGVSAGVLLIVGAGMMMVIRARNRDIARDADAYHRLTGNE